MINSCLPVPNPRFVFVTSGLFFTDSGIANANALCNTEAPQIGLPGKYIAVLTGANSSDLSLYGTVSAVASQARDVYTPFININTLVKIAGPLGATKVSTCGQNPPGLDCVNKGYNSYIVFKNGGGSNYSFATGAQSGLGNSFFSKGLNCLDWTVSSSDSLPFQFTNGNAGNLSWGNYTTGVCGTGAPVMCLQTD